MAYSRQPQVVRANGGALKQTPTSDITSPAGIVTVELEALTATTTSRGVVQIGSGLSITPAGILSATGSSSLLNVLLVGVDYTANIDDYYIGATKKSITITFPHGVDGKVYVVKNQAGDGSIKVQGTAGQKLDDSNSKTLGEDASLIAVFAGSRWNLI
jgi:hypothetical protein